MVMRVMTTMLVMMPLTTIMIRMMTM